MTVRVNYIGDSTVRRIDRSVILGLGLSDPGRDLVWNRANGLELDVPNDVAAFLFAFAGEFVSDDNLNFGDAVNTAFSGRMLGAAEVQYFQTNSTSTLAPLFGAQVEVESSGRLLEVKFSIPSQNSTPGQGAQWTVSESIDGAAATTIDIDFPFDGGSSAANLPIRRLLTTTRMPPPQKLVVYKVTFARFTAGVAAAGVAATIPATLSVVEL